jgi:DNA-binding CsgD family transcriptional regulator
MVTRPRRRYAPSVDPAPAFATAADGVRIGWMSIGSGPALVHLPGIPFSNAEAEWRIPVLRQAFTRLGEQLRFIQFDGRGTGRSQRDVTDLSLWRSHIRGHSLRLSPREIEVLRLLAGGETNGQIAARLGLSINTVERHVVNVYRKIDARGRAEATAWAIRNGVA